MEEILGKLEVASGTDRWYVLRTKSQFEKKVADFLYKKGINYYLPLRESSKIYQYRRVTVTKPLFPGYVFVRCNPLQKQEIVHTGYIAITLRVRKDAQLVDELQQIYFNRRHKTVMESAEWLSEGWLVEITDGPLKGMRGLVQNQKKKDVVVLQVNILRQAVCVKVNPANVKVLKEYYYEDD